MESQTATEAAQAALDGSGEEARSTPWWRWRLPSSAPSSPSSPPACWGGHHPLAGVRRDLLGAVDHEQDPLLGVEPAVDQV